MALMTAVAYIERDGQRFCGECGNLITSSEYTTSKIAEGTWPGMVDGPIYGNPKMTLFPCGHTVQELGPS
jgi:hypothetical protein